MATRYSKGTPWITTKKERERLLMLMSKDSKLRKQIGLVTGIDFGEAGLTNARKLKALDDYIEAGKTKALIVAIAKTDNELDELAFEKEVGITKDDKLSLLVDTVERLQQELREASDQLSALSKPAKAPAKASNHQRRAS